MAASGVDATQCRIVAGNLIWNDIVGRTNYGVERLPVMLRRVRAGLIKTSATPVFERLSDTTRRLDGDNGFGQFVGECAIASAIEMAKTHGTGIVGVWNSNFFGTGAYFVEKAAEKGMIALVLSNSFPKVAAEGGLRPVLGTNPFAFGGPRKNGRSLLVDMSTASLAGSTIREKIRTGGSLAEGLVIDDKGQPLTDPVKAGKGTLLPAAGAKGFGLALMVEMLSAVLTGAGISKEVGSIYNDFDRTGNNGHFFLVLDIKRWMTLDEYYTRFETLIAMIKASGDDGDVLLPGEARWNMREKNLVEGIAIEAETLNGLETLAAEFGIKPPWIT
ncbi:MAG: Ldh family oxidoreductase [Alphaproteobacteria bacterium]|nr:Ldh family oxidoreductase [Alphaproteobacteria bacterium]